MRADLKKAGDPSLGLGATPSVSMSTAPSVTLQWSLVSDPTSPRENDNIGLRPDQRSEATEKGGTSTSDGGHQGVCSAGEAEEAARA